MKCTDPVKSWLYVALLALLLLGFASRAHGQESVSSDPGTPPPSPSSSPSSPTSGTTPTDPWQSFDSLWTSLKDELSQSDADSLRLLSSLDALRIEVDALRSSSAELTLLYWQSEEARMTERELAEIAEAAVIQRMWQAERSARVWRLVSIIGISAAVVEAVVIIIALF